MGKGKKIISLTAETLVACLRGELRLKKFPSDVKILSIQMDFERNADVIQLKVESEKFKPQPPFAEIINEFRGTTQTGGVSCEE